MRSMEMEFQASLESEAFEESIRFVAHRFGMGTEWYTIFRDL